MQDFGDKKVLLGKEKINKYGSAILNIIENYIDQNSSQGEKELGQNNSSITEQDICKIIIQACKDMNQSTYYGATMLANFLKGNKPQQLLDAGLNNEKLYGSLNIIKTKSIYNLIEYLVDENVLYKTRGLYPTIRVNDNIDGINIDIDIVKEIIELEKDKRPKTKKHSEDNVVKHGDFEVLVDEDGVILTDINLLESLRIIRKQISIQKSIAPFMVCSNKTLVRLATFKPQTREEFLQIKGIRDRWYENFAHLFIDEIKKSSKI